jgi:hypothetical protein
MEYSILVAHDDDCLVVHTEMLYVFDMPRHTIVNAIDDLPRFEWAPVSCQ